MIRQQIKVVAVAAVVVATLTGFSQGRSHYGSHYGSHGASHGTGTGGGCAGPPSYHHNIVPAPVVSSPTPETPIPGY